MDWAQVINGVVALVAVASAHVAFVRLGLHAPINLLVHFVQVLILTWYVLLNLSLAFGLWDAETDVLIPLFRWAFGPLLATYALRQWLAARRVETIL